jgi:hypothetical protein
VKQAPISSQLSSVAASLYYLSLVKSYGGRLCVANLYAPDVEPSIAHKFYCFFSLDKNCVIIYFNPDPFEY